MRQPKKQRNETHLVAMVTTIFKIAAKLLSVREAWSVDCITDHGCNGDNNFQDCCKIVVSKRSLVCRLYHRQSLFFFTLKMNFYPEGFKKALNLRGLEPEGGGGRDQIDSPSNFLALNFCSFTDCQKLWHNCSLLANTSFDINKVTSSQKVTQSVCWLRNLNFLLETY